MIVWGNKITMSDEIGEMLSSHSLSGTVDNLYNKAVTFTYINIKTGKETEKRMTLQKAITLAESRREDRRYKNFEYHISK